MPTETSVKKGVARIRDNQDLFKHLWALAEKENEKKESDEKDSPKNFKASSIKYFREQRKALRGKTRV